MLWVAIIELAVGYFIFRTYPLLSMLFLGEGADSPLYSKGNAIMWMLSPIILPALFNIFQISVAVKNKDQQKVKIFLFASLIVVAIYLSYIIWWSINRGFHI